MTSSRQGGKQQALFVASMETAWAQEQRVLSILTLHSRDKQPPVCQSALTYLLFQLS